MRCLTWMLRVVVMLILVSASSACGEQRGSGSEASSSVEPSCGLTVKATRPDTGTVLVRGMDAMCTISFREVATLRDTANGELPRLPVSRAPGGQWLTATYDPGKVAIWSAAGDFERVIGKGPGAGPGEFRTVSDIVVDSVAGTIYIFSASTHIDVYALSGEYRRTITVPGGIVQNGVLLPGGTLLTTTTPATTEPFLMVIRPDTVVRVGPTQRGMFPPLIRPALDGVWSVEGPWYEVDHHGMPDGAVDFRLRRDAEPFPTPTEEDVRKGMGPILAGFDVDHARGLVSAVVQSVRDPDAPGRPAPRPKNREQARELGRQYTDAMVEIFTVDGRLMASRRYDYAGDAPYPFSSSDAGGLWYHVDEDDPTAIRIFAAVLSRR